MATARLSPAVGDASMSNMENSTDMVKPRELLNKINQHFEVAQTSITQIEKETGGTPLPDMVET